MPAWWIVAKNELRVRTSKIHKQRKLIPIIVVLVLIIFAFTVYPFTNFIISLMMEGEFPLLNISSTLRVLLFIYALMFFIMPLSTMLEDVETGQIEFILSTPVKHADILLGEFIGTIILYSPFLIGAMILMNAIFYAMSGVLIVGQIIISVVVLGLIMLALWIGTVLTAYIRSKIGGSERGKDLGRALMMIFAVIFVPLYMFGPIFFTSLEKNPVFNLILDFIPISWAAYIIQFLIGEQVNTLLFSIYVITSSGLGLLLLIGGYRIAGRIYVLTSPVFKRIIKPHGKNRIYNFLTANLPSELGACTLTAIKEFTRSRESIAVMGYMIGLSAMMFFLPTTFNIWDGDSSFANPYFSSFFSIWMVILILSMFASFMTGMSLTVGHKNKLWIYRKSPNGMKYYLRGKLLGHSLIILPLTMIIMLVAFGVIYNLGLLITLTSIVIAILCIFAAFTIGVGIFALNPSFERKGLKMGINVVLSLTLQMIPLTIVFVPSFTLPRDIFPGGEPGWLLFALLTVGGAGLINLLLGSIVMHFGVRHLLKME
jgi:hypothetical protein